MHSGRIQWEKAISRWNTSVINHPKARQLQEEIDHALIANACVYRFSEERFQSKEARWRNALKRRPPKHVSLGGHKAVEVPIGTTLRPSFLPRTVLSRLQQLGEPLERLLALSRSYLLNHRELHSLFGDPGKSEIAWIEKASHIDPIGQWVRIDFVWKWTQDDVSVKLLDINLLPGMTFINGALSTLCGEMFHRYSLCKEAGEVNPMLVNKLAKNLIKWVSRESNPKSPELLQIAVLARSIHGLAVDARLCAQSLFAQGASGCKLVSPTEIMALPRDVRLDGIIRMCRLVSKHGVGQGGIEENVALSRLTDVFSKTPTVPFFNAFLESHAWFFIWQSESFKRYAIDLNEEAALSIIHPLLPMTGVVLPDLSIEWPHRKSQLTADSLQNVVIKRAHSTGAQDLLVLHRASSGQRDAAFKQIQREPSSGWVIQELVEAQKEPYPLFTGTSPDPTCLNGFMVYGAYFSNQEHLGTHAVMSPISRKVHGGFDSFLMPTATFYERD